MSLFSKLFLLIFLCFSYQVRGDQVIDLQSGLIIDEGYQVVKQHCSTCHSATLIIQSKSSYQGWLETLRWMQKTQGMSLLKGKDESSILKYLTKNYGSGKETRRKPLVIKQWQEL